MCWRVRSREESSLCSPRNVFLCCTFSHFYSKLGHIISQHIERSNRKHRRGRSKNPPFASSHRAFFMGQKLIACDNYHWPFLQQNLWTKTFLQCVDINQSWSQRCEPASVHVQPKSRFRTVNDKCNVHKIWHQWHAVSWLKCHALVRPVLWGDSDDRHWFTSAQHSAITERQGIRSTKKC